MDWKKGATGKFHLLLSVLKKFDSDHGFLLSAGITFNLLICLVPLILLLLALLGVYLYRISPFLALGASLRFILKYIIPFFFTFWMCFLIYKIIPNRKIFFKTALQAALFTSLLWEVSKQLFGWYVLHLGRFSAVYSSLSTLAIFFLWFYYSSAILLLGGEVAFLLEKRGNGING